MKTIALIAQKGGTGKTSTALALTAGLTRAGKKVLAIDMDAQGNFSWTATAPDSPQTFSIKEVLTGEADIAKAIIEGQTASIIMADNRLAGLINEDQFKDTKALKTALKQTTVKDFDYCVIDNAPALNYLTLNSLVAADHALIITEADFFGYNSYNKCEETISYANSKYNRQLKTLGFVVNRYNRQTTIHKQFLGLIEDHAKETEYPIVQPIRQSIKIAEAQALRDADIFKYAPKATVTADYQALVNAVLEYTK